MSRLTNLPSRLAPLPSRIAHLRDAHGHGAEVEPWRKWFCLTRWRKLRWRVFTRDHFQCQQKGCGVIVSGGSDSIGDHIIPHRGDPDLFWDEDNVQTLCKPCHDRIKQAEERRAASGL